MALSQSLEQKLQQGLNPTQIQTIKFVQMTSEEFEDNVREELEENPFLEEDEEKEIEEDPTPYYKYRADISREDYSGYETVSQSESIHDSLTRQLGYIHLSEEERQIGEYIIGTIDDDGLLRTTADKIYNLLVFNLGLDTTEEEVERLIGIIQGFDPAGVCARSIQECLLLQLARKSSTPAVDAAIMILKDCFDDFTNKHFDAVKRKCHLDDDGLRAANDVILRLSPKPVVDTVDIVADKAKQIVPDFLVRLDEDNNIQLTLPRYNIPELRINKSYVAEQKNIRYAREEDRKEMEAYNTSKYNAAKSFIEAVKQRYNTLRSTMQAIIDLQEDYFRSGETSDLKPLVLKTIAERAGFDISTISRVVQHRYVDTDWGLKPLKFFFSEGMQTTDGEAISNREIKEALKEVVDNEDKKNPLSDEAIADVLTKKGYVVARRTVAKYREQLGIAPGRLRKTI